MKKRLLVMILATALTMAGCGAVKTEGNVDNATIAESTATAEASAAEEVKDAEASAKSTAATEAKEATTSVKTSSVEKADNSSETASSEASNASDKSDRKSIDATAKENKSAADASKKANDASGDTAGQADTQSQQNPETEQPVPAEQEPQQPQEPPAASEKIDYGRILFVGDSRTVDMFSADQDRITGEVHDGILVYAKDGAGVNFHIEVMGIVDTNNFDTLITWMGCNDYGNFSNYEVHYNGLLNEGKRLIVCTVGPTNDEALVEWDRGNYDNAREIEFNASLVNWANQHGVQVIDLYSYLSNTSDVYLNPNDGIHYLPQPTTVIWNVIRSALN